MTPTLETARLWLLPLQIEDAEQTQILFPQWEIVRYLSRQVPWPYPPDGVLRYYREEALPALERGDAWHWTLRLKSHPEQLIGCIVLMMGDKKNRAFWLGLPWHGQGYMTEACVAVTDFWFQTLKFPVLRVPKAIGNVGSRRISEKTGMRVVAIEEREYVSGHLPSEIWEITAAEWRAWREAKRSGIAP